MTIATRLVILVTLSSICILGAALWIDYRLSRDTVLERLEERSRDTIAAAIGDLESLLESLRGSALLLARLLSRMDYSEAQMRQLVRDLVEHNSDIYGATIALNPAETADGQGFAPYFYRHADTLDEVDLARGNAAYSRESWYLETIAAGEPVWVEPYFDRYGARVLMTTFSVPVFREDAAGESSLYAVVTADLTLEVIQAYLDHLPLGEHGRSLLLSRRGTIIAHPDAARLLAHYSDLPAHPEFSSSFDAMLQSAPGGTPGTAEIPCPERPGTCTLQTDQLQSTGWPLVTLHAQADILAPLHRFLLRTLLIGLACAAAGALVLIFVTRRLTRPLTALAAASDRIARGELDTPLPDVNGTDEVSRLVASFNAMTSDLTRYIEDLEAATAKRSRLEGELAAARAIQMSMLPGQGRAIEETADFTLWATVRSAQTVGGDLYTYETSPARLILAVGDVSDKGVPAALFMARAISQLQQACRLENPTDILAELNEHLVEGNENCMFVTLFVGALDLHTRQLAFASAGHTSPVVLRHEQALTLIQETGPALGLAAGQHYPTNHYRLQPGDRLAVFSDGVEEAFNGRGEMFDERRLRQQLEDSHALSTAEAGAAVVAAIDRFAAGTPQSDDITVLMLDIMPRGPLASPTGQAAFTTGPALVTRVITWLEAELEDLLVSATPRRELAMVAEEVVSNIDKYAGLATDERIELAVSRHGTVVELAIGDPGRPFNPLTEAGRAALGDESDSAEIGRLGVHLIAAYSDEQHYVYQDGYNCLYISRDVSRAVSGDRASPGTGAAPPTRLANMELTTTVSTEPTHRMARVRLDGGLNTDTAPGFEERLQKVLAEGHPLIVLDMKELDYISSAGLRVIFKAAKEAGNAGQRLAAANRKPHIDKVFEILKALPDMAVFANDEELDSYLAEMQERVKNEP